VRVEHAIAQVAEMVAVKEQRTLLGNGATGHPAAQRGKRIHVTRSG
jgi:hypothetical protein